MLIILSALASLQTAPPFDPQQYVKDHMEEIQREFHRQREIKSLSDDQALIVYDQCLARQAASLSRTNTPDEQIFTYARAGCMTLKMELLNGSPPARFARFKALDDEKAASFPALTKQLRERIRDYKAETGKSNIAPH